MRDALLIAIVSHVALLLSCGCREGETRCGGASLLYCDGLGRWKDVVCPSESWPNARCVESTTRAICSAEGAAVAECADAKTRACYQNVIVECLDGHAIAGGTLDCGGRVCSERANGPTCH